MAASQRAAAMPSPPREEARRLSRHYVKLCDLRDFEDPALRGRIREIAPGHEPNAELRRKFWEYAMLALFLEDVGMLENGAEILSLGAGHEEVLYWLTNRGTRVTAVDLYGEGRFASDEADATMLTDPGAFAPYAYREDRLDVRRMDARALEFGAGSFDVVFSLSSIEHFGGPDDVARAASEIGRVLRPGGYAFVVTECFVERHFLDSPLVQTAIRIATLGRRCSTATARRRAIDVFTPGELESRIIAPSGLELVQPLDTAISAETWDNVILWRGSGRLESATGNDWPHILLRPEGSAFLLRGSTSAFTSAVLAMRRPPS